MLFRILKSEAMITLNQQVLDSTVRKMVF